MPLNTRQTKLEAEINLLSSTKVQNYLRTFSGSYQDLAFKKSPFPTISTSSLLQQWSGLQTAKLKWPQWHDKEGIVFPPQKNLEQASSEITALYKAGCVEGTSLADCTGGMGIDTWAFAQRFKKIAYFETNPTLFTYTSHNLKMWELPISCFYKDAIAAIQKNTYDCIYLDPDRRHQTKGKVFRLEDCEPNLHTHLNFLLQHCETLLVKTSPMLDISLGCLTLQHTHAVHIIAVQNEVKELLWVVRKDPPSQREIIAVNIDEKSQNLFSFFNVAYPDITYGKPKTYLFEPHAAIMKSGGFAALAAAFPNLQKLHLHAHFFTGKTCVDFPGKTYKILDVIPYSKRAASIFKNTKAVVISRHFPLTVAVIRKTYKIKEGQHNVLVFTTLHNNEKVIIRCTRVS